MAIDLSHWYLTDPQNKIITPNELVTGYSSQYFYRHEQDLCFHCPNQGIPTDHSSYSRSELRELLAPEDNNFKSEANNWVTSWSSLKRQKQAGAVDGILRARLTVDRVSTTGNPKKLGRIIIGQIHAQDTDLCKLYFHKLPDNERAAIYFSYNNDENEDEFHNLLGNRVCLNPWNGVRLNESFAYTISLIENKLTVILKAGGVTHKAVVPVSKKYHNNNLYFKAGCYNQNNTGDSSDYAKVYFHSLSVEHPAITA